MTQKTVLRNLTFSGASVIETYFDDVNLSLRNELKMAKKSLDFQFKRRLNEYIKQLDTIDETELNDNIDIIKSVFLDKIIRPTLVELMCNSSEKNLYTVLKLDSYNITLEEVTNLQKLVNSFESVGVQDSIIKEFAKLMLNYVKYKIAKKRSSVLENLEF